MNSNASATNEPQVLSKTQLSAIAQYEQQLAAIDDPIILRKKCLDIYTQSLRTHNTYTRMWDYQFSMQEAYTNHYDYHANLC